ncbi:MAG TPA: flagellar biosynthetic protein FliQ [Hyphomicrobiaceae bacterium]|nr:flagellar biosynthetic protein FliQ [Hyphomicrobiaceae bacterium]
MNEADAMELVQAAIWTVIMVAGPCVLAAMVVGIAIALLQALTQVQEITLTFVPKIMAIFVVAMFSAHFMGANVFAFAQMTFLHVERGF